MNVAAQEGIQGGQILGSIGAGGAAFAVTVLLVVGVRGKNKIRFDADQAVMVGLIAGTLYVTAASIWSTPGDISLALAQSIQGGISGGAGMGAIALVMVIVVYGIKLKPRTSALFGIAAPPIWGAAGGIWGIASTTLAGALNQVLGAA